MRMKTVLAIVAAFTLMFSMTGAASAIGSDNADKTTEIATLQPITPGEVTAQNWECNAGLSCYYDGHNGTNWFWNGPGCGWYNLGDRGINDRMSSIRNRGAGAIELYNWVGYWDYLLTVPVGYKAELVAADNIVDAVYIYC